MIAIVAVVCLAVGIGIGRVKNARKLAALKLELDKAELVLITELKKGENAALAGLRSVVAAIRKAL